jgi:hypothetical protein
LEVGESNPTTKTNRHWERESKTARKLSKPSRFQGFELCHETLRQFVRGIALRVPEDVSVDVECDRRADVP